MFNNKSILITETPRDAMQGWPNRIPASIKAWYINALLKVGFHTVDCGSFVSPKAVPQMADTSEVLDLLDVSTKKSELMVLVGNVKGAEMAASEVKITTVAFPYSVSPTFMMRNLNTTAEKAVQTTLDIKAICDDAGKHLRIYVAMAFGNPYGDVYSEKIVFNEVEKLLKAGFNDMVFSDITGEGTSASIAALCSGIMRNFPELSPGIHLHSKAEDSRDKVLAAYDAGITKFEGALGGYGGCPMTGYELLANINTLHLSEWFAQRQINTGLDEITLKQALLMAREVFV